MSLVLLIGLLSVSSTSALRIPLSRTVASRGTADEIGDASLDLRTVRDLIYIANVTIGGTVFPLQVDTGSSDLWISHDASVGNAHETSTMFNLTYGLGWAHGPLTFADVIFSSYEVSNQAFVHATTVDNPALAYGAEGILGLGFTTLSNIDFAENQDMESYSSRSLMYRIFEADPSIPNFIAFSLQRSIDPEDEVEGALSIGEFDPEWAHVQDVSPIPTFPVANPSRWNVLIDAILVGQNAVIPTTSIPDAPANKAVGLLDTGTSYSYVPANIAEAIYSSIPGAELASSGYWTVPCDEEVDIAIQIGGWVFPLHPLDITPASLADANTCIGSFVPQSVSVSQGQFDWLIGDNVLRSMYNVYDFGDYDSDGNMGNPYVKLLSLIDPDEASADFASVRGSTPKTGITYGSVNGTMADSTSTSVTLSKDVANSLNLLGKLFPVVLAIMGLNALVLLGLLAFGIIYFCRKRKRSRVPSRTTRGRLSPMPLDIRHSYVPGHLTGPPATHAYQPVSMAVTEDTFVPPTPTLHKFESKIQPGDRPRSMTVPLRVQQDSMDEPFIPPAPAFHADSSTLRPGVPGRAMDRPNSVA